MTKEPRYMLEGEEVITTYFNPLEEKVMFAVSGTNLQGENPGKSYVYLYKCIDDEVSCGIDTFEFTSGEDANKFVEQLPEMSAFQVFSIGTGVQPKVYNQASNDEKQENTLLQ